MQRALDDEAWNLATRRAQEALELAITAPLSEMSVDACLLRSLLRRVGYTVCAASASSSSVRTVSAVGTPVASSPPCST